MLRKSQQHLLKACLTVIRWGIACLFFTLPSLALAAPNTDMFSTIFDGLTDLLTGKIAKGIGIVAIVAVGYLWLGSGRISARSAISTIIGLCVIFSAGWLATQLGFGSQF